MMQVFSSKPAGGAPLAGTLFVAPTGCSDTGPGSAANPWCTIQKAANTATAGAVVTVAAGTYQERVTFPNAGTLSQPITFQCAVNRACIVDGGTRLATGWTVASGFETGTFKQAISNFGFGVNPGHASYNDQMITFVRDGITPTVDYIQLTPGSLDWDGIEASCRNQGTDVLCHFQDNQNPNGKDLKLAPKDVGAFHISGISKGHLVFDGFYWKNAYHCVCITDFAHHVTIKNSTCTNGYLGIDIKLGAHTVTIDNNIFFLNYIYENHGLPPYEGAAPGTQNYIQWNILTALRNAMPITARINFNDAGTGHTISNNTIDHTGASGINIESDQLGADPGYTNGDITIRDNVINNCADYCLQAQLTVAPNLTVLRNTFHTFHNGIRLGLIRNGKGPLYIGFNTFRNEGGCSECARGGDFEISATPELSTPICLNTSCYFYHNTMNNRDTGLVVYSNQDLSRQFWINNVMTAKKLYHLELIGNMTFFSRNWVGGNSNVPASDPSWWTAPNSRNVATRIWADAETAFALPPTGAGSTAINLGFNLNASWSAGGAGSQPALPGALTSWNGSAPDAGAKESQ